MIPLQEQNFTSAFVSMVLSLLWRRLQTKTMQKRKLNSDKLDACVVPSRILDSEELISCTCSHVVCHHPVKSPGSRVGEPCVNKNALDVSIESELYVFVCLFYVLWASL